jgi:hypothetical protein
MNYLKRAGLPALFFMLIILGASFYLPALKGPFVLDDLANLHSLHFVHTFTDALNFAATGETGIRYISYLSFTVHSQAFINNDSLPFKSLNLILHAINSTLLFAFSSYLLKHYLKNTPILIYTLSFIISAIWMLHPVHTGTVLYSVQRMNLLATFFTLIGCIYHVHFMVKQLPINNKYAWLKYTVTLWFITLLAIFSKENGILLLAFIALINQQCQFSPFTLWQRRLTLYAPLVALIALLIITHRLNFSGRSFTMFERLLSETIIVKEYFLKIIAPTHHSFSLFYDDFSVVQSISDSRFLLVVIFWLCVIFISIKLHKIVKGFGFGIAWFFIGHALESTIIPLELYFDHRNYLPSYGLIFSLVLLIAHGFLVIKSRLVLFLLTILCIILMLNLLIILKTETHAWKTEEKLASSNYIKHPNSLRAHQFLAEAQLKAGLLTQGLSTIHMIHNKFGQTPSSIINELQINCISNPNSSIDYPRLINDFRTIKKPNTTTSAMQTLYSMTKQRQCYSLTWEKYQQIINSLLTPPINRKERYNLTYLLVLSFKENQQYEQALEASLSLPYHLKSPEYIFLQLDLAIQTHNIAIAHKIYDEITAFDPTTKLLYKNNIDQLNAFMEVYFNEK